MKVFSIIGHMINLFKCFQPQAMSLRIWLLFRVALYGEFRQRLHGTGSFWNRYEIGTDKACVYTGPGGSGTDRICYLVPNGFTYEGDPIWNRSVPISNRSRVNRVDPYHCGSDAKRIWTYPIPCKQSGSVPLWISCQTDLNISYPV